MTKKTKMINSYNMAMEEIEMSCSEIQNIILSIEDQACDLGIDISKFEGYDDVLILK